MNQDAGDSPEKLDPADFFPNPAEIPAGESYEDVPLACADVMRTGTWVRINDADLRWVWKGDKTLSIIDLLGLIDQAEFEIRTFGSVHPQESISVAVLRDGGLISYQRRDGTWLHTLSSLSAFRDRIFELNLVPLTELGQLLKRNIDFSTLAPE